MARSVMLDEIHVTLHISNSLDSLTVQSIGRTLAGRDFLVRIRSAIRAALAEYPVLAVISVRLSR